MNTVVIETLGCRLNQIESEAAGRFFLENQFNVEMIPLSSQTSENVEVCMAILNTCAVTQKAEQKARRIIRLMLKKFPNAIILVTGCYAQLSKEEILKIDERICVIGGQIKSRIEKIPSLLKEFISKEKWNPIDFSKEIQFQIADKKVLKKDFPEEAFKLSTTSLLSHSRPSLKIQDGCNSNCSYCTIHFARGHSVSIDVQTAIDRVLELEALGNSEVVLTTVNIAQYKGRWKDGFCNFPELLELLIQKTKFINFRISSLYPEVVTDEFCKIIASPRVRPHFHISVQSGSDKILGLMNRSYNSQNVIDACNKLKLAKKNPFIACDIITGFPGETEEDFNQTMQLCKICNFSWVHAFPFSERPGTLAVKLKNKIPQSISTERAKKISVWAIQQKINYINQYKGIELSAILETRKKPLVVAKNVFVYHLMTENFIHCRLESDINLELKKSVKIKIVRALDENIKKGGDIEAEAIFS